MSAIFGVVFLDGRPVEHRMLEDMSEALAHRGNDGSGIWIDGRASLGHRMRYNTPESVGERLPRKHRRGDLVITADVRLDNREELFAQLDLDRREPTADSEIILLAYDRWGEDCVSKLLGDFVFAIWDEKKQTLFCGRDSMGVKHFYYYYEPNRIFALASEAKALFRLQEIPKKLNEAVIGDILILNHNDKEETPYENIRRLPPNNAMIVNRGGLTMRQYWHPQPAPTKRFRSHGDYEEEFRELFTKAVTDRLRSAGRVGAMLSGGLDSSSISCVASRQLEDAVEGPLETFSAIFPKIAEIDPRIDERVYIDSVVRHTKCRRNFVEADAFSPLLDLEKMHWHADHPLCVPNVFMDWALFKSANERNVRVLLSGFDGDSTVSYGYEALESLARQGRWIRLISDAACLTRNIPHRQHTLKKLIWKQGFKRAIPGFARELRRVLARRPLAPPQVQKLPAVHRLSYNALDRSFAANYDIENRYFEQVAKCRPDGVDSADDWWNGLCSGLFAFALETFEKTAAAFDVEPRFPFFDRRLIEFCISLPASQRLYRGWTRSILRRSMTGIIPPDVQWRTDKANIGLSFKVNLLNHGRDEIEDMLSGNSVVCNKFVDADALDTAYRRYESDPLKYESEPMLVLACVHLSNWLRDSFPCRNTIAQRAFV